MLQAPVWCHTDTYRLDAVNAQVKKRSWRADKVVGNLFCVYVTALIVWCLPPVSDYSDSGNNQDMHNYFRQASVNLKEILKNPGIWDPFILSYVEVNTYPELPAFIKTI